MSKYDLKFDLVETPSHQRQLEAFINGHVGNYGDARHIDWNMTVNMPGIISDERRALSWWEHGQTIASSVVKPVAQNFAELKLHRVADGHEGVHLGAVMMAHAFKEAVDLLDERGLITSEANEVVVQLDTNPALESYFSRYGFVAVAREALYVAGREEVIMQRAVPLH